MSKKDAESFRILPQWAIRSTLAFFDKLSIVFVNLRIHPNTLSYFGFAAGAAAGLFFFLERPAWAAVFIILCGSFDILDGKVALHAGRKSRFGAILDSSLDRYAEFFIFLGIAHHFRNHWALWVVFFALLGSTMVSYTRARAEGLGISCGLGIMQRAERLMALFLGVIAGILFNVFDAAMIAALVIIALVSNITAFQRISFVRQSDKSKPGCQPPTS